MKCMRLGFTEGTLFIKWYIHKYGFESYVKDNYMVNFLFSTSGYYDKEIKGNYFDLTEEECEKVYISEVFNTYMETIMNGLKNCNYLFVCMHCIDPYYKKFTKTLIDDIRPEEWICTQLNKMYFLMENKRVLIISCYATLMENQVTSGNCNAIYPDFPTKMTIIPYDTLFTFFNNGPDNNILETCERYKKDISKIEFDIAVVSCGAYTHILIPYITDCLGKNAFTTNSSCITDAFGIIINRTREHKNNFWVNVPEKYKPEGYEKIEGGCYW